MDILGEIQGRFPSFSKGQKRIAQYILDEFDKAAFMTASVLGKTVQVSESTVVRFASELGYNGYPEMQKELQEMVLTRLTSVQRIEVADNRLNEQDFLAQTLREDAERIRYTQEHLDKNVFDATVEAMQKAKRIYIIGVRSSAALASFLEYYLRYIFEDVRLIISAATSVVFEQLLRLTEEDMLIAISFPRYSSAVLQAMVYARDVGAKTVALTDCDLSPLAEHADFLLTAKSDMISMVDSLVAPMSVINALIVGAANGRKKETTAVFDKLEEVWDTYHVYEKYDN